MKNSKWGIQCREMSKKEIKSDIYGMSPLELQSIGISNKSQRTFLEKTLDAMKRGCK